MSSMITCGVVVECVPYMSTNVVNITGFPYLPFSDTVRTIDHCIRVIRKVPS